MLTHVFGQEVGHVANFTLTGKEHENVALPFAAQLFNRVQCGGLEGIFIHFIRRVHRRIFSAAGVEIVGVFVTHFNRVQTAGHFDDRGWLALRIFKML